MKPWLLGLAAGMCLVPAASAPFVFGDGTVPGATPIAGESEGTAFSLRTFAPERRGAQREFESALMSAASSDRLRAWHDLLASRPHVAGTEGDLFIIESMAAAFREMGLETEIDWFWAYLPRPIDAAVEIVSPVHETLSIKEPALDEDPDSGHPDLPIGWNAYSGSGDVTAHIVYANYGRKEDFAQLRAMGVDVSGAIVLARYGRNYRGYKAKFAEEAGAAGLIMFTDPADSGYMRGLMYPEGGWSTAEQIQRGSVKTIPWPGDPLTPGIPADQDAERLDPELLDLPRIPVQPVGWSAAQAIMERMTGPGVPEGWQGAMPFAYRLTGGPELRVRLMVKQEREITKTANVTGTLRGSRLPDEFVIVGGHHDSWGFGASDPTAGTILVMESARVFSEMAKSGRRPDRSVVFAGWGAEEFGIIGSVEWVERHADRLRRGGVAYINLDMATMGPLFGGGGAPTLTTAVLDATRVVPQAREPGMTVFEEWSLRSSAMGGTPRLRTAGGGSDHIGFAFHVGVPSVGLGSGGAPGVSYHSNYDTLTWYRRIVGDDYEPALMNTRVVSVLTARLANADVLPLDPRHLGDDLRRHLTGLVERGAALGVAVDLVAAREAATRLERAAGVFVEALLGAVERGGRGLSEAQRISAETLLVLERAWLDTEGLPGRPWFRNVYMAPDDDSGYSAWPLPGVRASVEVGDDAGAASAVRALTARITALSERLERDAEVLKGAR